jgi:transposase
MSDTEWAVIEPALPAPAWRLGRGGRPAEHCRRDVVDGIRYLVKEGIQWRAMPADFPHWRTVYDYADGWQKTGATEGMHDELRRQCRIAAGRTPEPTAAVIDSQSVKAAETVARPGRGYDAGKKINGRKRHIVCDTIGLLLVVMVTAASVQDRDGGRGILKRLHSALASVAHVFADGGYQGQLIATAKSAWNIVVEVVKKPAGQLGFAVLPRRWVVERTFSWLLRWRRLVRDYERLPETHEAMVKWAMVGLMLNRLAPPPGPKPWSSKNKRE